MDTDMIPLWISLLALAGGIVLHASWKLGELEQRGQPIHAGEYVTRYKFTMLNVVLSAIALFLVQWYLGEGGPISAFFTGFACNSAGDKLRARADARNKADPTDQAGA